MFVLEAKLNFFREQRLQLSSFEEAFEVKKKKKVAIIQALIGAIHKQYGLFFGLFDPHPPLLELV